MIQTIKDRKNTLKSRLRDVKYVKLTKTINLDEVLNLETRINELEWLIKKLSKTNC